MLLLATGFIFVLYALIVQASFIPNSWRWDARPYHLSTSLLFSSQEPSYLLGGGPTNWSALPHTLYSSPKVQARREGSGPGWVPPQLEVVISYYDEPIEGLSDIILKPYAAQPQWTHTSTLYHKGLGLNATEKSKQVAEENLRKLMNHPAVKGSIDTGIAVENEGRDGGTYLKHMRVISYFLSTLCSKNSTCALLLVSTIMTDWQTSRFSCKVCDIIIGLRSTHLCL